jgi:hypothetical protein
MYREIIRRASQPLTLAISLLLAIAVGCMEYSQIQRLGDSSLAIANVEAEILKISSTISQNTFVIRDIDYLEKVSNGRTLYRLEGPEKKLFFIEGPLGTGDAELTKIASELFGSNRSKYVSTETAWLQVQTVWYGLTTENQRIARAKSLLSFESKPEELSDTEWSLRAVASRSSWRFEEENLLIRRKVVSGFTGAILSLLLSIAVSIFLGLFWEALLIRIREFRRATREQP